MSEHNDLANEVFLEREAMRPTARTWLKHLLFLSITLVTATIAGVLYPFGLIQTLPDADPQTWPEIFQFVSSLPGRYAALVGDAVYRLSTDLKYLKYGLSFSLSLLFVLVSHEMGHYIACRIYKVDATLPYFIPTPPMIGPAGTFGAFIKIVSPMPSRKAVFDIGVAGPIAGFIALIPIAIVGIATMEKATPQQIANSGGIVFADPLFMKLVAYTLGTDLQFGIGNAFYFAAWVGLLVTALNLIPSGQLDGGHAVYSVLGETVHRWTGRIAFVIMAALSILGWIYFNSPSGFLIAVLLGVMMRIKHPQPWDQRPLDPKRKLIAVLTLVIFVLCFTPFPIQIN
ncbi:MAG: site-2 protease family protein [Saprospiraceae bacterium]|nr:site-2 protease family protein [Pyrinomonadaceae bacterium]